MKLSKIPQSPLYEEWRFITDDPWAKKVQEYDKDARLALNLETDQLGLARLVEGTQFNTWGLWVIACSLEDRDGNPLRPPPDGRVEDAQRRMDGWRKDHADSWAFKVQADRALAEKHEKMRRMDFTAEKMDEYVMLSGQRHGAMRPQSMQGAPRNATERRHRADSKTQKYKRADSGLFVPTQESA